MAAYKLKEGIILRPFGASSSISNENLSDDIAEFLLESGRATENDFETLPKRDKPKKEEQPTTTKEKTK